MFPFCKLRDCALDQFYDELTRLGELIQVPLRTLDYATVCEDIELHFTSPIENSISLSDPWNTSCNHQREEIESLQQQQGRSTKFQRNDSVTEDGKISGSHISTGYQPPQEWDDLTQHVVACNQCSRRFARRFMEDPDQLITVFVDSNEMCYVEVTFVDLDDGVPEWRYRFLHSGPPASI